MTACKKEFSQSASLTCGPRTQSAVIALSPFMYCFCVIAFCCNSVVNADFIFPTMFCSISLLTARMFTSFSSGHCSCL